MVWDCVRGLNALYSGEKLEAAAIKFGEVSATQRAALEHIFNSVQELGPPPVGLDGPGALQQLRAFDGYGEDQVPAAVKSYDSSLLSLPAGDDQPVSLASLLGEDGGKIVDDFVATRLLNQDEARRRLSQAGVVRCYSDPKLLEPRTYSKFVARLFDSGLIEMSLEEPTEKVEIFFVGKKDGRLRMVVDCRRSNQWFCPPDKVSLATADVLSRIDLSDKVGDLHVATADLKDAFYHFMLPLALRQYFGLRSLTAGELGINKVGDIEVGVNTRIHPRLRVLPMGWSHALWWCQTVHQKIVGEVGAGIDTCLQDKAAVPKGDCMHLEYVDNFVCLGTSKDQVHGLSAAGVQALRDKGLVVHEEETGHGDIKVLGWQFKGSHLRPLPHRIWRLIFAMRQLLKIGRCSGKQLERVIGHATFVGLGRREVLSIFGETYTYIHSHYYHAHRLWPSVRRELALWISLCPLLWRDLAAPWASEVTAVDASTWGLGAVVADFTPNEVRELGRFSERWRFELPQFSRPRAAALGSSMIEDDGDAAGCKWALATQHEAEARLPPMQVVEEKPLKELFEPVRKQTVDRSWKVVGRFKWRRQEGMPVLEGRASLYGIKHALRKVDAFHKRHLILSDSTAAICALDRGRGRAFGMRRVTQQAAALCLASGVSFHYRFIPSEFNPADQPSRGSLFPSRPRDLNGDPLPRRACGFDGDPQAGAVTRTSEGAAPGQGQRGSATKRVGREPQPSCQQRSGEESESCRAEKAESGTRHTCRRIGESSLSGPVLRPLEDAVCGSAARSTGHLHGIGRRPADEPDAGGHVRLRGRPLSGGVPRSGRSVQAAPSEGDETEPASESPVLSGLEKAGPSEVSTSSAVGGGVPDGFGGLLSEESRDRPVPVAGLCRISSPRRSQPSSRVRFGGSCGDCEDMVSGPSPFRNWSAVENRRVRRDDLVRHQADPVPSINTTSPAALGDSHERGVDVLHDRRRGAQVHELSVRSLRDGRRRRRPPPVQAEAWRPQSGRAHEAPHAPGGAEEREVEKLQLGEAVRERGEGDTATSGLAKASTRQGNRCRRVHRKGGEWPALKVCKPVGVRIYLLVFSKHSSLSRAVSQICGGLVLLWDVHFGPEYDLRNPAKRHLVYQWVRGGGLSGIVVLTPAGTFSVTSTLRSDSHPMGLPGLKSQQQIILANGNLWLRFSVRLVTLCWKLFVPAVLANPSNSRIWLTPPMSALQRLPRVTKAGSQLCCWGGTTRRSITFIGVSLEVEPLRNSTHCPKKACLFTGHSHSRWLEVSPERRSNAWAHFWPPRLSKAVARCFYDFEVKVLATNFEHHVRLMHG